ncbi:glutamate synthase (NADPH/NADH) small chain [Brevibacterium sp. Mu109]|uniref:glutamate synthase subunit beta n=1 Tax=Brevibacterium sp. Mu109 TaxID=1255669 RepID=UPI000C5CCFAE|nr:glutamate synthase subunit beta [Brevibacterium sp. Mu109]SMX67661.1 glutamate synthase (NADPH/NADH) small chain [Brevibacterium sp. Mu109]
MADPRGFLTVTERELPPSRPVPIRLLDFHEVQERQDESAFIRQAGRCMDCGVPFCHQGCPLGNLIPEFNDAMWRGQTARASELLHATNNFPEFTGRACPAPCESACVLGISQPAVTIKNVELTIVDRAFEQGLVVPQPPERMSGRTVAVVGTGPAGLACAQQLTRAGHSVIVYEREDRIGGLLRYGIPDFKLEKHHIDRRLEQMRREGTRFRTGVAVGEDLPWETLRARVDAVVVCTGATLPRELSVPGRELSGVHWAMDYLVPANRRQAGDADIEGFIDAAGLHVVVIGGGDTGSDCVGTALRQGAASVTTLAIGQKPPVSRPDHQPWPTDPRVFEVSTSHEEGGERRFLASTVSAVDDGDGNVVALRVARTAHTAAGRVPQPGTEEDLPADLVLIAMGFTGPEQEGLSAWGLDVDGGPVSRDDDYSTALPGVFVAGDAGRGQSLIVWAIAEGRAAAAAVDADLMGETSLPRPVAATDVAMTA